MERERQTQLREKHAVLEKQQAAVMKREEALEKTGGDSLAEVRRNLDAYLTGLDPHDETGETG